MNWCFKLRILSLLASAAFRLAKEDPAGFAAKVSERVRTSENEVLSKLPAGFFEQLALPPSQARSLIDLGYLSEGIELIETQGKEASRSDRHLAERTRERLEQLREAPPVSNVKQQSPRKHRVLHYLTNSVPHTHSGYTVRTHNVLKAQQTAGLEVQGVTRVAYPVLVGRIPTSGAQEIDGIEYHRLLPASYPVSLLERDQLAVNMLVEQAESFAATVLHTTTDFKNAAVVSKAAARLGIPWVYEVRGELESTWLSKQSEDLREVAATSEFYRLARTQETAYAQAASAVVTLSDIAKIQFTDRGVDAAKIQVVPNAIGGEFIGKEFDRSAVRTELGLPDSSLVGTVTSIVEYEGIDTLIRSLEHLPESFQAVVVGEGTARIGLEDLARELGLESRVYFVGRKPQEDIWKWYAALDVFVVPRKNHQVCRVVTPIKALMAQALGVPVVTSDLPALREVTGGLAEYVVPENPSALANGIASTIGQNQSGADWTKTRTWLENGRRYRALYDDLGTSTAE